MIRTSTIASVGRAALGLASVAMSAPAAVHVAPHPRPAAYRIQERPLTLFQDMALREWCARFAAQCPHDAVVAVVTLQHSPPQSNQHRVLTAEQQHGLGLRLCV